MQDVELLKLFRDNAEQGLEYMIEQYTGFIRSIVYRKLASVGTEEDMKECVSDVIVKFYQQIDQIDLKKGSIKAYLAVIASRKGIDFYRKLMRTAVHSSDQEYTEEEAGPEDLEEDMIKKEERRSLLEAIEKLGEPDREIFVRKYYLGQKTTEIAEALELKSNTVDKKISRGLKKLRIMLGGVQDGETCEYGFK